MGKNNRTELDHKQKLFVMNKKRDLIDRIRKEYITYKKSLIK